MMRLSKFEYVEPRSLSEATSFLKEWGWEARVLAGGTDLLVNMKQRVLTPRYLVDLNTIPDLDYITYDDKEGLKIGPMTRVHSIHSNKMIQEKYPAIARSALLLAGPLHQNMATIGGNICLDCRCWYYNQSHFWRKSREACLKLGGEVCFIAKGSKVCYAVYSGDIAPSLWVYGARLRLTGAAGDRVMPISGFFTGLGDKETVRGADEIVSEITVPPPAEGSRGTYLKFRQRNSIDFPLVGVAVNLILDGKLCREARVVFNAIASAPLEAVEVEEVLRGQVIDDKLIEAVGERAYRAAKPISDTGGFSAVYKKKITGVLTREAVKEALSR